MKCSIAQFNPKVGDVSGNLTKILSLIDQAKKTASEWVLFPELSLLGYPPRDLLDYPALVDQNLQALEDIKKASQGIGILVGFVDRNPAETGRRFFNCASVFRDGKELLRYKKRLLPYYDIFEEERYFESGTSAGVFEWQGRKYGVAICEDIWNHSGFIKRAYPINPLEDLYQARIEALFVLTASPFELGKPESREKLISKTAQFVKAPVYFCNQVGGNDELLFDGGSLMGQSDGKITARAGVFQEELLCVDERGGPRAEWPQEEAEWLEKALVLGIRDYVLKCGAKSVCFGLSGGIDSSVVAVLAARAIGKENVTAVALPTRFNLSISLEDAKALAKNLGIEFQEFAIEPVFEAFQKLLNPLQPNSLTLENLQPRIRMSVLMAVANQGGKLLLNTSNKSEISEGYATLYGDSSGAIAVLGDLLKRQVYLLAEHFNKNGEVIPCRVITRAPSAELRENQLDQDTLPPYEHLDPMVEECIIQNHSAADLVKSGFTPKEVDIFSRLHRSSEYKRRQLPPVLRVSTRAFGMGRRIPVAARYFQD